MEWVDLILAFIVDVVEAGAWPGVIAYVAVKLRDEFSSLIKGLLAERMTRAQTPVGTFEFGLPARLQDTEAEAEDAAEAAERALPAAVATDQVRGLIEHARRRAETPEGVNELLALQLFYERVYRFIFRSQMQLLEQLDSTDRAATPLEIQVYHGLHAKRAEEHALDEETWLRFLYDAGLIEDSDDGVVITETGRWYLTYCNATGYVTSGRIW